MGSESASHRTIAPSGTQVRLDAVVSIQAGQDNEMDVRAVVEDGHATGRYVVIDEDLHQYNVDLQDGDCNCPEDEGLCEHSRQVARAINYTDLAAPDQPVAGEER